LAGDIKSKWGTSNQAITISLASLADGAARQSNAIDLSSLNPLDEGVRFDIKAGASGVSSAGYVEVYLASSVDGGSTYSDGATGSDGTITLATRPCSPLVDVINLESNAAIGKGKLISLASAAFGFVPDHVAFIIRNKSGAALDSTEGSHNKRYQGFLGQYT
jgi:hypothetical protein